MPYVKTTAWLIGTLVALARPVWAADDLMSSQLVDQAHYWQQKNRDDMAGKVWRKLLRFDPRHPEALVKLGAIEARAGNFKEAEDLYLRAAKLPVPPPGLKELSAALSTTQGPAKAAPLAPVRQEQRKAPVAVVKPVVPADIPAPTKAPTKLPDTPARSAQVNISSVPAGDPKLIFSDSIDLAPSKPRP